VSIAIEAPSMEVFGGGLALGSTFPESPRPDRRARHAYRRARELTDDGAERRFIERRLTELAITGVSDR
jgi:hypothetical protein